MSQGAIRASGTSIAGAYFFMFLLFFWPMVDLLTSAWPLQLGNLQWRYGFMGLAAAFLHTPILALLLAMILAFVLGHQRTLAALGLLSFLGVLILLVVLVLFPLDVLQLRSVTERERLASFQMGAAIAELKHLTAFLTLLLLGLGGWRTSRTLARRDRPPEKSQLTAEVLKAQKKE